MAEKLEQPSTPTLHHLQSSQSMRVLWALEEVAEANLYRTDFEYKLKIYRRMYRPNPELTKLFPLGKSPIMTVEENDGAPPKVYQLEQYPGVLTESTLLLDFVNTTYANQMWDPATEEDTRRAKFFDTFAHNTMSVKTISALLFEVIPAMLPWGLSHLVGYMVWPMVAYWKKDMQPGFQVMEDSLSEKKPFFAGEKLGLADFDMSWTLDMASQRG